MSSQESYDSENQVQYSLRSKRKKAPITKKTQKKQRTGLRQENKHRSDNNSKKQIVLQSSDSEDKSQKDEKATLTIDKQQVETQLKNDYSDLPTFLYRPKYYTFPDLKNYIDQLIRVIIDKNDFPPYNNFEIFYGTDFYSSDSDIASIVQHSGTWNFQVQNNGESVNQTTEQFPKEAYGLEVILKVLKPRNVYNATERHSIRSMKRQEYSGRALKVIKAQPLMQLDKELEFKKMAEKCPNMYERKSDKSKEYPAQHSILPGLYICYNLSNLPSIVYQISAISDFVCEDKSLW